MRLALLLCCLCACGRLSFDARTQDAASDSSGPTTTDANPLLSSAVAYWKFDETGGTVAYDSTGHNNLLDATFGVTWTTGKIGGAVQTDGSTQFLVTRQPLDLSATNQVTVSFWFNHVYGGVDPFRDVVEMTDNFNNYQIGFAVFADDNSDCGSPQLGLGVIGNNGGSAQCFPAPAVGGPWHHIVAVFDRRQAGCCQSALFLDGAEQSGVHNDSFMSTNNFGADKLYLMARGGTTAFTAGALDELVIFDRALTPAEIATL